MITFSRKLPEVSGYFWRFLSKQNKFTFPVGIRGKPFSPVRSRRFVYAWQVNGFKGAYKHHGKQRVPGPPTCHYGSRYPRV